jgi:NAD(P)-dependent dehydrogenase (short-subunit alcohol dehydrogenase family)
VPGLEQAHWIKLDATEPDSVHSCLTSIVTKFGPLDGLIHCAGGFCWAQIENTTDEEIDFLLGANLKSAILLVRGVIPMMKERGYGRMVLVGSRSANRPAAGTSVYAASKAGLNAFVSAVAEELRGRNITINAVLPGIIDTPANREAMPEADFKSWIPTERLAEFIYLLFSDSGASVNGAGIEVAGG